MTSKILTSALLVSLMLVLTHGKPPDSTKLCFFVDGKALCGEEGIRAQEEQRRLVAELQRRQAANKNRGDVANLEQSDDPSMLNGGRSRYMYTDPVARDPARQANNDKGHERPDKGQQRPAPTTASPCRPATTTTTTTTTTTEPPCPLVTTTEPPMTPCEKYKQEQMALRSRQSEGYLRRGFQSDQPVGEIPCPSFIARQQQQQEDAKQGFSSVYQRGDPAELSVKVESPRPAPSSELPKGLSPETSSLLERLRTRGRFMLYHTFQSSQQAGRQGESGSGHPGAGAAHDRSHRD